MAGRAERIEALLYAYGFGVPKVSTARDFPRRFTINVGNVDEPSRLAARRREDLDSQLTEAEVLSVRPLKALPPTDR